MSELANKNGDKMHAEEKTLYIWKFNLHKFNGNHTHTNLELRHVL